MVVCTPDERDMHLVRFQPGVPIYKRRRYVMRYGRLTNNVYLYGFVTAHMDTVVQILEEDDDYFIVFYDNVDWEFKIDKSDIEEICL